MAVDEFLVEIRRLGLGELLQREVAGSGDRRLPVGDLRIGRYDDEQ
jgi:hypothetical protein